MLQGDLLISSSGSKTSAWCGVPNGPPGVGHESLLKGCSSRRVKFLSSVSGEVEVHALSGEREMVGGSLFDVLLSNVPCHGLGDFHDFSIDWGEFRLLEVGAVHIEGVFLPSVFESEELSGVSLILFGINVGGDIEKDSDFFGDIVIGEPVGLLV